MLSRNLVLALAFAAGGLAVFAFAPFSATLVAPVSLAILFVVWDAAATPRRAAALGFAWGVGLFGFGASWVFIALETFGGMPLPVAVIATAGHNLITEALYLHVPMFLLPFDHYEQQLNAQIIQNEQLGYTAPTITESNLRAFLSQLDKYRQSRRLSSLIYDRFDGDRVFLELIETMKVTG